ncbi:MAG: hypothetical protein AAFN74_00270 [Myxococcota bacterium]
MLVAALLSLVASPGPAIVVAITHPPDGPRPWVKDSHRPSQSSLSPGLLWADRAARVAWIAERTLRIRTRLRTKSLLALGASPRLIDACSARSPLSCWVKAALSRPASVPFDRPSSRRSVGLLLLRLESSAPSTDTAKLQIAFIDLELVRNGLAGRAIEQADGWLLRTAHQHRQVDLPLDDDAFTAALAEVWDRERSWFERQDYWWPNGMLQLGYRGPIPYRVRIDGVPVKTATTGVVQLGPYSAGAHELVIESRGQPVARKKIEIPMGRRTRVNLSGSHAAVR